MFSGLLYPSLQIVVQLNAIFLPECVVIAR